MSAGLRGLSKMIVGLEFFVALGAFAGGAALISSPDGSSLGLSLANLKGSPFRDYYIPGLILLICNGIFPTVVAIATLFKLSWAPKGHMLVGVVLIGWIGFQILFLGYVSFLQPVFAIVGALITLLGWIESRRADEPDA